MKEKILVTVGILFGLTSCNVFNFDPYKDNGAQIVDVYPGVYNLKDLNTKYDEYNSAIKGYDSPRKLVTDTFFVYSTNSGTEGKNFDIWKGKITFEQKSRLRNQKNPEPIINSQRISPFLGNEVNTDLNEFGPYFLYNPDYNKINVSPPSVTGNDNYSNSETSLEYDNDLLSVYPDPNINKNSDISSDALVKKDDKELIGNNLFFYASDKNGDLDIYYYSPTKGIKEFFGNKKGSNERYFSYDYKRNVVYFASDRDEGKYHIYKFENKSKTFDFDNLFNNKELEKEIVKVDVFNSEGNDTCPLIVGDNIIFASDRSGGKGGYDIYISNFDYNENKWLKPKNAQDVMDSYKKYDNLPKEILDSQNLNINTKYDEFRPFLVEDEYYPYNNIKQAMPYDQNITTQNPSTTYFKPNTLIFSSNRPEGKGGFDLYLGILPYLYINN